MIRNQAHDCFLTLMPRFHQTLDPNQSEKTNRIQPGKHARVLRQFRIIPESAAVSSRIAVFATING